MKNKQIDRVRRAANRIEHLPWEKVASTTPTLISWAGHLSPEGKAVADWLNLIGTPLPKPPDRSLLTPAQCYLRNLSDVERARLWTQYQAQQLEPTNV